MSRIFVDRRSKKDRRAHASHSKNLPKDLYGQMRRKRKDRRAQGKSLAEDYQDFMQSQEVSKHKTTKDTENDPSVC